MRNSTGNTPLHCACNSGHLAVVRYLVEDRGAQVDVRNSNGFTPLHLACNNGHLAVVQYLVEEHGAHVDVRDNGDDTPLYVACCNGHLAVVSIFGGRAWRASRRVQQIWQHASVFGVLEWPPCHGSIFGGRACAQVDVSDNRMADASALGVLMATLLWFNIWWKSMARKLHVHKWEHAFALGLRYGHLAVVQYLVEKYGAQDAGARWRHASAFGLHIGHLAVVRYLVEEHGAQVECAMMLATRLCIWLAIRATLPWFNIWWKSMVRKLTCAMMLAIRLCIWLAIMAALPWFDIWWKSMARKSMCATMYGNTPLYHSCSNGHLPWFNIWWKSLARNLTCVIMMATRLCTLLA